MHRPLTQREQFFLLMTLFLGIICLGFYGLYRPIQEQNQDLSYRLRLAEDDIREARDVIRCGALAQQDLEQFVFIKSGNKQEEEISSSMIAETEEAAGRHHIKVESLKTRGANKKDNMTEFFILLNFQADLKQTADFLSELQGAPRYFEISDLRLNKNIRSQEGLLNVDLILKKTFF